MTQAAKIETWVHAVVISLDRLLNSTFWPDRDAPDTTVSLHAARDQAAGKRLGCVVCRCLAVIVQRRHCELTLAGADTPVWNGLRAAAAMVAFCCLLDWALVALVLRIL